MSKAELHIQLQLAEYLTLQYPDVIFRSDLGGIRLTMGLAVIAKRLSIAMKTEMWYNDCAETNGKRGVLLLNAIGQHNLLLWAKRPLLGGFTSRHSSQQRWQPNGGRFVYGQDMSRVQQGI